MLYQLLLALYLGSATFAHDVRLSLCTIEFEAADATALISFRLFTDDLALATALPLLNDPTDRRYDDEVIRYLNQHFKLSIKGEKQELFYFAAESNEEVFEISFLLTDMERFEEVEVQNTIMLEQFEKQKNIVRLNYEASKQQYIMDVSNTKITF
ncbi:MAG: DUF6702 family protein [Bacteroidota bacterium]